MDIVTVQNLKKTFGKGANKVEALRGIDLNVEKGSFTAIIGASGSGKTTLLNMIGGMDVPDEGEVTVDGVRLSGLKERELAVFRRSKVGFVYQNFNLVQTLTVRENILFPLSLAGSAPDTAFFDEVTSLLRLKDRLDRYPPRAIGRRPAAGGNRPGADREALHPPRRRADRQPRLQNRPECPGAFKAVGRNLPADPHHDHPQPGNRPDVRAGRPD